MPRSHGRKNENTVPCAPAPIRLLTRIREPCRNKISAETQSPSPLPCASLVVKKASKTRCIVARSIPHPSSAIVSRTPRTPLAGSSEFLEALLAFIKHPAGGENGEPAGARTQDQRLKRAMLYQLSYRAQTMTPDKKIPQSKARFSEADGWLRGRLRQTERELRGLSERGRTGAQGLIAQQTSALADW